MLGHEPTLSRTNSKAYVYVCACGDIGAVHYVTGYEVPGRKRRVENVEAAIEAARIGHAAHVAALDPGPPILTDEMVANQTEYLRRVAPTVRRVGRSGRG